MESYFVHRASSAVQLLLPTQSSPIPKGGGGRVCGRRGFRPQHSHQNHKAQRKTEGLPSAFGSLELWPFGYFSVLLRRIRRLLLHRFRLHLLDHPSIRLRIRSPRHICHQPEFHPDQHPQGHHHRHRHDRALQRDPAPKIRIAFHPNIRLLVHLISHVASRVCPHRGTALPGGVFVFPLNPPQSSSRSPALCTPAL